MSDVLDLSDYRRVTVITGAGISAASGIPTYRDGGSGWRDARQERMSHASRYGNHLPELWQFWGRLRGMALETEPNAAHLALAAGEKRCVAEGGWLRVATQNIDGLHQRAGSTWVAELHGSIHRTRCLKRGCSPAFEDATVPAEGEVPRCEKCGRRARPDVVLFGEELRSRTVKDVQKSLMDSDLCLYVGTSGNVWPVSDFVTTARLGGARCVLVNADPWDHLHPDFHDTVIGPAEKLLPEMFGIES